MTKNQNTQSPSLRSASSTNTGNTVQKASENANDAANVQNKDNNEDAVVEVVEEIIDMLAEQHNIKDKSKISRNTSLMSDLGLDSLDLTESILTMEDKFSCHISDEDAAKLRTVDDIARYIVANRNKSL